MSCILCGSERNTIIGKPRVNKKFPNIFDKKYMIVQCKNCTFYYIAPNIDLTQNEWEDLYKGDYFTSSNSEWIKNLHNREKKQRLNMIKKYSEIPINRFLDLGCGEGFMMQDALQEGWEIHGLDIVNNLSESINHDKLKFVKGNIFEANYPENYFDAIYMDSVLEHIKNPIKTLKEIKRILCLNGLLYLIVPNEDCLSNDFKKILYTILLKKDMYGRIKPFVPPYHIQGFNMNSLRKAFEIVGFKIISLSGFGGDYPFWKAHKMLTLDYLKALLIYGIDLLSIPLKKQPQIEAFVSKPL